MIFQVTLSQDGCHDLGWACQTHIAFFEQMYCSIRWTEFGGRTTKFLPFLCMGSIFHSMLWWGWGIYEVFFFANRLQLHRKLFSTKQPITVTHGERYFQILLCSASAVATERTWLSRKSFISRGWGFLTVFSFLHITSDHVFKCQVKCV